MSSTVGVADRVYREIRDLLRSGDVVPGQRLPNERKLAEMKGASRTQVRDALLMLQKEGLVERKIGSGTYLSERAPQIIELADAAVDMSARAATAFMRPWRHGSSSSRRSPPVPPDHRHRGFCQGLDAALERILAARTWLQFKEDI